MTGLAKQNIAEEFVSTVTDTLKHYNDPLWLGQRSPLATPYFLGFHLQKEQQPESVMGRGRTLQNAISQAAASIWPGELPQSREVLLKLVEKERRNLICGPRYLFLILDLRYLRRFFLPSAMPNTVGAMYDLLNVSESSFFEHLQVGRRKLAEALLRVIRPSLRLEHPLSPVLVGRDAILQQCSGDLMSYRSVSLTGQAGIGKTSVGAYVARHWPSDAAFWHTFRPGLNDDLESVVFGLAHFLHQHECSSLWLQLRTNTGLLENLGQVAGFLREDLACAAKLPVLLCFDEVDLLHTLTTQPRHGVHKQILELLESLRTLTPLLLIGQRGLIDTDVNYEIQPLTINDTDKLLRQGDVTTLGNVGSVHRATGGNPRLLEIYVALQKSADPGEEIDLGRAPSIKPLFNRLWKRLYENEKQIIMGLSVFRSIAPIDVWQDHIGLESLNRRSLLKIDAQGGVSLLPIFREFVYEELSLPQRRQLNQAAAVIRGQRGQYTEAAYHLGQADQLAAAIELWYQYQDIELEQGHAGSAYILFKDAKPSGLTEHNAKQLRVIQDRLSLLHGDAATVLENIDSYSWHLDEKITADALDLRGQAHLIHGHMDSALSDFDSAISVLGELSIQIVQLHRKRGQMYIEQADLDLAKRETALAQFEIEQLKGLIEMAQGKYLQAQVTLKAARQIAADSSDAKRTAKTEQLLAMAAGNYGDYIHARQYAQAAMSYFERTGDRLSLENLRAEMAGFYLNERKFAAAIEPSKAALRFFENIKHDLRIGYLNSNLAEAYFETGQLELAEKHALRAIQSENPRVQPYACYTLGLIRYAQSRTTESEHAFQTGIYAAQKTGDDYISAYLYQGYGRISCQDGRYDEGVKRLRKALFLFSQLDMKPETEETSKLIDAHTN